MTVHAPDPFAASSKGRERDDAVRDHGLAVGRADAAFDDVVGHAARLCGVPIALVTVLDDREQWVVAAYGATLPRLPREQTFCDHAIRSDALLEIRDARLDPRVASLAIVLGPPHIRFYAGVPLIARDGTRLGALCVLDRAPRGEGLDPVQREGLAMLAKLVVARLDERREGALRARADRASERALDAAERRFRALADAMPQMVWSSRADGFVDYYNSRWYAFTGLPPGTTDGDGWEAVIHPDDIERTGQVWGKSLATGNPYEMEYRLRNRDGLYRWALGRALPLRDEAGAITRWFGTCTEIHEQKLAFEEREVISQELSHRIKNIFSVISGLVSLAARADPAFAPAASDLRERITTLGRAHDFVRPHSPASRPAGGQNSLATLLGELFRPYQDGAGERVVVRGDDAAIDDRSATPFALLFHELATNAAKYGALSTPRGQARITIARGENDTVIDWIETGGPTVTAPGAEGGFGSQLIELSAVRQLGGSVERAWPPEGMAMTIIIPNASFKR